MTLEGLRKFLRRKDRPYKYADIVEKMQEILEEDRYNDKYGRVRMHKALEMNYPNDKIPSINTINKIMLKNNINTDLRKPHSITEQDKKAYASEDLLKRDFKAEKPLEKCVTDITEVPCKDGKLYVSGLFDLYDVKVLGLSIKDNMKADLCVETIKCAYISNPMLRGAIIHSDRGKQYTSTIFRAQLKTYGLMQSMNSAGGRCHDNARCESMWARMKEELIYGRYNTSKMMKYEVKELIWQYFMSYWNNRRICTINDGYPPAVKERLYYESLQAVA